MNTSPWSPHHPYAALLAQIVTFVEQERDIATARCFESWARPLDDKLHGGLVQPFVSLDVEDHSKFVIATLGKGESRFREGDQLCVHDGSALSGTSVRGVVFESEGSNSWKLRCRSVSDARSLRGLKLSYAESDVVDLSHFFFKALEDIATRPDPSHTLLALIQGEIAPQSNWEEYKYFHNHALDQGLNLRQAEAVGKALANEHIVCIQGPPGTGKTRVLALAAALMVARGERVLVTSHTHNAINNALNRIALHGVATAKIGHIASAHGLVEQVDREEKFSDWTSRGAGGYVVGATPFATCSSRLEACAFDTVIFDEASQVTVPLALMAMRKAFCFYRGPKTASSGGTVEVSPQRLPVCFCSLNC